VLEIRRFPRGPAHRKGFFAQVETAYPVRK
jgi:hypothetical protein